jgi:hypothetical protein
VASITFEPIASVSKQKDPVEEAFQPGLFISELQSAEAGISIRCRGLQGKSVQDAAHIALQRLIDHLVLLHTALAAEGFRDDFGGVVIAVACQIADRYLGTGNPGFDHVFDIAGFHCHDRYSLRIIPQRQARRCYP